MIDVETAGEIIIFTISDALDTRQSRELDTMLEKMLLERKHFFIFNMGPMHFLSTSGIQILLKTLRTVKDMNGNMVLCNLNNVVKKALKILSLDDVFTIADNKDAALKTLKP